MYFSVFDITCQILSRMTGSLTVLSINSIADRANFLELGALKEDEADEWMRCIKLVKDNPSGIP